MSAKTVLIGLAALGLASGPAYAGGGFLGSSGNAGGLGGLLGGASNGGAPQGGGQSYGGQLQGGNGLGPEDQQHQPPKHEGGQKPGSWSSTSAQSQKAYSADSNSSHSEFNKRDTTIGGFELNPQISKQEGTKSYEHSSQSESGCKCGGSKESNSTAANKTYKSFSASFPIKVNDTTLGGFESSKSNHSSSQNYEASKNFTRTVGGSH